jgi:hypothetical protein
MNPKALLSSTLASLVVAGSASAALTDTYINETGTGVGSVSVSGGQITLTDSNETTDDMWDGGDTFIYYHEDSKRTGNFTATARVIGQSVATDGRWGKNGIRASRDLTTRSQFAMTQIASGNDSQATDQNPGNGIFDPVPPRLAGRESHDSAVLPTPGMFEQNNGANQDIFLADGSVNMMWLQLSYDQPSNTFSSSWAFDAGGVPGAWNTVTRNTVPASPDGYYVGLAYSAHNDLGVTPHSITYDNFSIIPEPSSAVMALLGVLGLIGLRRRR